LTQASASGLDPHTNTRLEIFCDSVFAIALTLLIIDIKIPASEGIRTTRELWRALAHLGPSLFAFVLSFGIILITWVNHHGFFKLVNKSSATFIYANGFLLLTVVFMPFPTALLGEYLLTDHASPAVVIYNAVIAVNAIAWILISGAALGSRLTRDDTSTSLMRQNRRNGYFAFVVYSLLALIAVWFPLTIAIVTTVSWTYWLTLSLRQTVVQDHLRRTHAGSMPLQRRAGPHRR
jgi:TMEM175 potassium channel family protein